MAVEISYATKATVTVTLTSLANGSARESTVIDNTTPKYLDAIVRVLTNGQASGTGPMDVYVYAALGDAASYTDGATGSDAAFTAANRRNSRYLGSIQMNAASAVAWVSGSVAALFGGILPEEWGLIFINLSGAALSGTGGEHVAEYQGIEATVS